MQADVRLAHPRLRSCADARDGESICHAAKPRREYNSPGGRIGKHTFRLLVRNGTALRYLRGMRERCQSRQMGSTSGSEMRRSFRRS